MRYTRLAVLLTLAIPASGLAQQTLPRDGTSGFALEALRPALEGTGYPFANLALFASGHVAISPAIKLVAEVPFATSAEGGPGESGPIIGAPYIGAQARYGGTTLDIGVRAPLASDPKAASIVGLAADLDRIEAFLPDVTTIKAGISAQSLPKRGMTYGVNLTPAVWLQSDGAINDKEVSNVAFGVTLQVVTGKAATDVATK